MSAKAKPKDIRLLEVYLGNQWIGWKEDPKITIKENLKTFTIEMVHDEYGLVKTTIEKALLPAYTIG